MINGNGNLGPVSYCFVRYGDISVKNPHFRTPFLFNAKYEIFFALGR